MRGAGYCRPVNLNAPIIHVCCLFCNLHYCKGADLEASCRSCYHRSLIRVFRTWRILGADPVFMFLFLFVAALAQSGRRGGGGGCLCNGFSIACSGNESGIRIIGIQQESLFGAAECLRATPAPGTLLPLLTGCSHLRQTCSQAL